VIHEHVARIPPTPRIRTLVNLVRSHGNRPYNYILRFRLNLTPNDHPEKLKRACYHACRLTRDTIGSTITSTLRCTKW